MKLDFFFWWSVISTILSVILLGFSIWQYVDGRKQKERSNSQVKIWMQDANGIAQGLLRIIQDNLSKRYTSTDDVCNAIWALQASSFALYQSLYEERTVSEEEYKQQQREFKEILKKQQTEPQIVQNNPETTETKSKRGKTIK